jgi:hypothetical protein
MHSFYLVLWSGNLVPLCQHSQEKTSNNPKQVFEDNYEPPSALFDGHASRGNLCPNGRRTFRENFLEVYCQMSSFRQSIHSEYCKTVKSNAAVQCCRKFKHGVINFQSLFGQETGQSIFSRNNNYNLTIFFGYRTMQN